MAANYRGLIRQYHHEAGFEKGEPFQLSRISQMTEEEIFWSKPVDANLLLWLDAVSRRAKPDLRAQLLSIRRWFTRLRERQAEVWAGRMTDWKREDETVKRLVEMGKSGNMGSVFSIAFELCSMPPAE